MEKTTSPTIAPIDEMNSESNSESDTEEYYEDINNNINQTKNINNIRYENIDETPLFEMEPLKEKPLGSFEPDPNLPDKNKVNDRKMYNNQIFLFGLLGLYFTLIGIANYFRFFEK